MVLEDDMLRQSIDESSEPVVGRLASISTHNNSLTRWRVQRGGGALREFEDKLFVAEPGHGGGQISYTRGNQIRIMGTFVQGHHDRGRGDLDLSGQVQQITKDRFRLGMAVLSSDALRHHAV